jgi:hypothetical protein
MDEIKINHEAINRIANEIQHEWNIEFAGYEGKIIYRPHRGGTVFDSLEEAKEFDSIQEMKEYIVKQWDNYFLVEDIVIIGKPLNDNRINWKDVRYVCSKRFGNEDNIAKYGTPQCIGYCATEYVK